ncbi:integral membrane protein TerC [Salpingoeca rosetta]|uniref:Integral membrane protein TerC n=1 Tax=Salpingoeca rosetta (strain ATCC 50818 / BSB-021) TaxID=946362 RepID=F2UCG3_SALR5|nr:integral membrane protein TerC [Salpingoeca rosetta]EGD74270.1 integral membrane protein TerC [Salpingoeca rosetta]|eukprot:XP_004993170.1 integral membrane protein TerC [Salpingoeca rosetta]
MTMVTSPHTTTTTTSSSSGSTRASGGGVCVAVASMEEARSSQHCQHIRCKQWRIHRCGRPERTQTPRRAGITTLPVITVIILFVCVAQQHHVVRAEPRVDGAGAAQPQNAGVPSRASSSKNRAIGYLDELEFQTQCTNKHLGMHLFQFSRDSLKRTRQFASAPGDEISTGAFLGRDLTFPASLTDLPVSFDIVSSGHAASHYSGIVYGHMHDTAGEEHAVLQVNSHPGNDDFRIAFSNKVYHRSTPYQQLYAVGITLHGNADTTNEVLTAYSPAGEVLVQLTSLPPAHSHGDTFLGVVSNVPIGAITFDENGQDDDPVSIKQVYIGVREANLLDDLHPAHRRVFWIAFNIFIVMMLAVDMLLGRSRSVVLFDALVWSAIWIALALLFSGFVFISRGRGPALVWLTSYLLEKFLSVDNLFVFLTIFAAFRTPSQYQHKVLSWGIAGAIVLRAVFIFTGVLLVEKFSWLLALFGVFLVYTGVRAIAETCSQDEEESMFGFDAGSSDHLPAAALKNNLALSIVGSVIPVSRRYDPKGRFFVREDGGDDASMTLPVSTRAASRFRAHWIAAKNCLSAPFRVCVRVCGLSGFKATPLFAVLVIVETTDMVFAADSIPAVLSITQDPFVAYTSNIFAVLGLRALYFALAAAMTKFRYLGPGLGIILLFIGAKLLLVMVDVHVSVEATLLVVLGTLAAAILLSLARPGHSSDSQGPSSSGKSSKSSSGGGSDAHHHHYLHGSTDKAAGRAPRGMSSTSTSTSTSPGGGLPGLAMGGNDVMLASPLSPPGSAGHAAWPHASLQPAAPAAAQPDTTTVTMFSQ